MSQDTLTIYGLAGVMTLVAALLGDYLERSETSMAMVQQMRRWMLAAVKKIPRA